MIHHRYLADLDAMIAGALIVGDDETVRDTLFKAAVFAGFTSNAQTIEAEQSYALWVLDGRIGPYGRSRRTLLIAAARAWIDSLSLDALRDLYAAPWRLAEAVAANVFGLGVTKASFTAALAGRPEAYCLDTHAMRHVVKVLGINEDPDKLRHKLFYKPYRWQRYRELGDPVFGDRAGQWDWWLARMPGSSHEVYFTTVLGAACISRSSVA